MSLKTIVCPRCKSHYSKKDLKRNCSNCFACTGCEVYICTCGERIEVKPPKPYKRTKRAGE